MSKIPIYVLSILGFLSCLSLSFVCADSYLETVHVQETKEQLKRSVDNDGFYENTYILHVSDTISCETNGGVADYNLVIMIVVGVLVIVVISFLATLYILNRTTKRKLEVSYQIKEEALEAAEKASIAKSNFMSRMSHEIRTPLNAVIGYNTIAKNVLSSAKNDVERKNAEMKVVDCINKSELASKHLLVIINDVLDVAAIESGKIRFENEKFDFKGMISSLTTIFFAQAKSRNIKFNVTFDKMTEEWMKGDQIRVNQVLTNLLSNAIKFTNEGGKVDLIIRSIINEDVIDVNFEVNDTGIGMSKEYLERIWLPFEQADPTISRRFGGTGLGLAITKSLVDLMGGTITVESKQGVGSKFVVNIKFGRVEQPENADTYDFSQINALIVDDDVSTCDYVKMMFERCGARSRTVNSGQEALNLVSEGIKANDPYTVCLVDWRMPGMDGMATVKKIREISNDNIPIIVITAYDFSDIVSQADELGITKFVSKPLFQSSLFDLLANISGGMSEKKSKKKVVHSFNGENVLLAEDNDMNMEIACKILESMGLRVSCARNGFEAVDLFKMSPKGTYSVILMDVHMPMLDGYQATTKIRESEHPDAKTIPIIAMTADAFAENVAEAFSLGMNAHVSKPIDLQVLYDTLKKFIE